MKFRTIIFCFIGVLCASFSLMAVDQADAIYDEGMDRNSEEISSDKKSEVQGEEKETGKNQEKVGEPHQKGQVNRLGIFSKLTQNRDNPRGKESQFRGIYIGGLLGIDLENQTKADFVEKNSNDISLAIAKLNFDGFLNDWAHAHVGFFYSDNKERYYPTIFCKGSCKHQHRVDAEEGYLTFVNFDKSPFYLSAGKRYLPFGRYHRYPVLKPLTQQLSETRATALEIGFVDESGLYGSLYTFRGIDKVDRNRVNNYGTTLGYENLNTPLGFDIGVGYLHNMADVGIIRCVLSGDGYHSRVGALSVHADIISGPFDFIIRYVTALDRFISMDLNYQRDEADIHGAKPRSGVIKAGYTFKTVGQDSKIDVGYQWSHEAYSTDPAIMLRLPYNRVFASYGIDVLKHTILIFEVARDHDYAVKNGGTNQYNNIATVRLTALLV